MLNNVEINESKCVGCGKCAKDCISQIIRIKNKKAKVSITSSPTALSLLCMLRNTSLHS
jgi:Fe-S-cluster-containing hydrogenase component 2